MEELKEYINYLQNEPITEGIFKEFVETEREYKLYLEILEVIENKIKEIQMRENIQKLSFNIKSTINDSTYLRGKRK
jgi:hypothetical protein